MAELSNQNRWKIAGALVGSGALSWLSALALTRVGAAALALPEGAELAAIVAEAGAAVDEGADPEGPVVERSKPPTTSSRSFEQYNDPIMHRSLFDSAKAGGPPESSAAASEVTGDERKSDLPVVLLATMVAEPANHSSALIAEEKGAGAIGYGIGDQLLGEAQIIRIEPRKVYVQRDNGAVEYISMEGGSYSKDGGAAEPKGKKGKADEDDGVTKEGPNKFIVDQALVDKIMQNPEELYSQVRAVPHKGPGGEVDGYRLSGIRRRSVFNKLGIKNGDVIHSVNGRPLDSMANAMDAYQSLGSQRSFTFEVSRKNERQNFDYEIR